jgi:probable HAF family extracellular repeat protein
MMKRAISAHWWKLLAFGAPSLSTVCLAAQTPTFTVQLLGNLPGATVAGVSAINNAGEAVGSAGSGTSACPYGCAVIWHDNTATLLEVSPEVRSSSALGINNAGQVVGNVDTTNGVSMAVVWNNGTPTMLPSPVPQYTYTYASAINDAGQVVGAAYPPAVTGQEAIEWNGLTPTVLDTEPGCTEGSYATAINSQGTIVGVNLCPANPSAGEATIWHGTTGTLLSVGKPSAINDAGLIVGEGIYGATAWVNGVVKHLATGSVATAVNKRGIIVGKMPGKRYAYHAALWGSVTAAPQDLNDLISAAASKDYILTEATGINENCTIVANGFLIKNSGATVAFLLKPIDPARCAKGLVAPK